MKDGTIKLSGPAKDRFLEHFISEETGLAPDARQRLTQRARTAFTSVRVRKAYMIRRRLVRPSVGAARPSTGAAADTPAVSVPPPESPTPQPLKAPPPAPPAEAPFDTYAVRLVPVFQREGRDGLLVRLAAIAHIDHLRQLAKAQQIVLPAELRTGEAAPDAIRTAIVDAVAKRIADRRAAAG